MRSTIVELSSSWTQYGLTPFILTGLAGFLLTFLFIQSRGSRKTFANLPPRGPREWPVLGSLPSLAGKDLPHVALANMAQKYGPIFSMRMGSFYTVVLNDYSLMRQAFTKSGDDFSDRPKLVIFDHVVKGKGLICAYFGQKQIEHRRFSLTALRSLGMGKYKMEETLTEETRHLSQSFARHESKAFVPFHDIVVSVSNIICWLCLGKRFEYNDETFKFVLKLIFDSFEIAETTGLVNFVPILRFLPKSGISKIADQQRQFDEVMKPIVDKIRTEWTTGSASCFVEMYAEQMVQAEKENPGKHTFTKENVFHSVADLFVAGTETTATTLKWALLYMMMHEDVQRKVHEELDRVVGRNRLPSLVDRPNLPYTEATLLEIQRFATITPLGVPHAPIKDTVLNGYDIPKGTVILPNIWAVHHDPELWKDPQEFNPNRFLDPDTNKVIQREELIPFSIGRRKCMGEQLAKAELYIFFTHLLHRFQFRKPEGAPPFNMKARNGATLNPEEFHTSAILRDGVNL